MSKKKTTSLEKKFIEAFDGDILKSAKKAGYKGTDKTLFKRGLANIQKPYIAEAIKNKNSKKAPLVEAVSMADPDEHLWRRLGDNPDRDLNPITHDRMLEIAYHLYERNPMAHRMIELTKDFVVGDGITYKAEEEDVQAVLDDFWDDPVNLWDLKQYSKALELGLFGEQCYPVFVNPHSGKVRIGNLDPSLISDVITNPENAEEITHVVKKDADQTEGKKMEVVHQDEETGLLTGETFYFAVNKVSNSKRGRSDLLSLSDFLDGYEQMLFNQIDREALINAFVWDVTLEGMNEEEIAAWLKKNGPPKPGAVRAHNEKVTWEANAPDLKAADSKERAAVLRKFILGGAGFPDHWFAEGSTTNKATAQEMGVPTLKRLKARQRYFKYMIDFIFRFVIDQAISHGTFKETINTAFTINFPELVIKDILLAADAMNKIVLAAVTALNSGVISQELAGKWIATASELLGVEVDPAEEIKKAQADSKDRDLAEALTDYSPDKRKARADRNMFSEAELKMLDKDHIEKIIRGELGDKELAELKTLAMLKLKGKERGL